MNDRLTESSVSNAKAAKPAVLPRKLSREARREQLIEATIETLAVRGFARTTLTDVANHAGLSHGLVNFHFQTKERLLAETLEYLSNEYRENYTAALAAAKPDPASQLDALIRADFNPLMCNPARLSAWCSFWGEAQSRPLYQELCGANDQRYILMMEGICARLVSEGGYGGNPERMARALRVVSEGLWLDLITTTGPHAADEAHRTVLAVAAGFFPRHFTDQGLI